MAHLAILRLLLRHPDLEPDLGAIAPAQVRGVRPGGGLHVGEEQGGLLEDTLVEQTVGLVVDPGVRQTDLVAQAAHHAERGLPGDVVDDLQNMLLAVGLLLLHAHRESFTGDIAKSSHDGIWPIRTGHTGKYHRILAKGCGENHRDNGAGRVSLEASGLDPAAVGELMVATLHRHEAHLLEAVPAVQVFPLLHPDPKAM